MLLTANAVHGIAGEGRSELLRAVVRTRRARIGKRHPRADTPCGGATWPMLEAEPRFWPGTDSGGLPRPRTSATIPHRIPAPYASAAARTARRRSSLACRPSGAETAGAGPAADAAQTGPAARRTFLRTSTPKAFSCVQPTDPATRLRRGGPCSSQPIRLALLDGICDDLYVLGGGQVQRTLRTLRIPTGNPRSGFRGGIPEKISIFVQKPQRHENRFRHQQRPQTHGSTGRAGRRLSRSLTPRDCGVDGGNPRRSGNARRQRLAKGPLPAPPHRDSTASPTTRDSKSRRSAAPRAYIRPVTPPTAMTSRPTTACC